MPSWSETHEFLRHRFRLEEPDAAQPERLALTFVTQLVPGRNEAQRLVGVHEVHNDESWLLVRADACAERSLEATEAVALGARLRVGGIALVDGSYEVRRAFQLRDLSFDELGRDLQYLAMEASFVRAKARPLPGQPEATPAPAPESAAPPAAVSAPAAAPLSAPAPASAPASPDVPPSLPPGGHWAD